MNCGRFLAVFIPLFIWALTAQAAAPGPEVVVMQAAGADMDNLQVLSATTLSSSDLRWATWIAPALDGAQGPGARLALFRRSAGGAERIWDTVRPESYEPSLYIAYHWQFRGRPVLLFRYQLGAGVQDLELFGLDPQDRPKLLDHVEADIFDIRAVNGFVIEGHNHPEPSECWTFSPEAAKLKPIACPP
jgi:hypothetical protein